jgi:hypothetical protein
MRCAPEPLRPAEYEGTVGFKEIMQLPVRVAFNKIRYHIYVVELKQFSTFFPMLLSPYAMQEGKRGARWAAEPTYQLQDPQDLLILETEANEDNTTLG